MRHGTTAWNARRRFQGQSDIPLSDDGRAQARALAGALAEVQIDAIFASDLSRARETALAIAAPHELDVRMDQRLREFNFGAWEGLTWEEILERFPSAAEHERTSARSYTPDGGESFNAVRERVGAFLRETHAADIEHVAVVSHAGVLHAVLAELMGERFDGMLVRFSPASVTRIDLSGPEPLLQTINEIAHLPAATRGPRAAPRRADR